MTKRKLFIVASSILVIVIAVVILLALYYREKDVGLKEPPKFLFNISGKGKDALRRPLNVAVTRGKIFVTDSKNGRVQVFNTKGDSIFSFSTTKDKKSTDSYPFGIAIDDRERIYVTELRGQKLMVFDSSGSFIHNFPPKKNKTLKRPVAVAFANNKLYLTDTGDQKVKVFNLEGKLLLKFGKAGPDKGQFAFPNGIAALDDGTIFVSDSNNKRIQVFNDKGKFEFTFGEQTLALPRGIAIDWLERLHVVDTFGRKVSVFDKRGNLLFSYSVDNTESQDGEQTFPAGVAIDNGASRIYVTDRLNNSINVWGYP